MRTLTLMLAAMLLLPGLVVNAGSTPLAAAAAPPAAGVSSEPERPPQPVTCPPVSCPVFDTPFLVDEHGDTMHGPLLFDGADLVMQGGGAIRLDEGSYVASTGQAVELRSGLVFNTPGTPTIRSANGEPIEVLLGTERAIRLEANTLSPSIVIGHSDNVVATGVEGATISGGGNGTNRNRVLADFATVAGGSGNLAQGRNAAVAGGEDNAATDTYAFVGGGSGNRATNFSAAVAGGKENDAAGHRSFIGAGYRNMATGPLASIGGGFLNLASGTAASVGGGDRNSASGIASSVAGGERNRGEGLWTAVSGGNSNVARGVGAMVPGGAFNRAEGNYSLAAGYDAKALHDGSFVWADRSTWPSTAHGFVSTAADEFSARATGGVRFVSAIDGNGNPTAGVTLAPGSGSWSSLSDRASKEGVTPVDPQEILERLRGLEVAEWSYVGQGRGIRHMGPMAQDFHQAFGLGEGATTISTVDADGVALAAIQGLADLADAQRAELEAQAEQLESQRSTIASQQALIEDLARRVAALEADDAP